MYQDVDLEKINDPIILDDRISTSSHAKTNHDELFSSMKQMGEYMGHIIDEKKEGLG